MLSKKAMMAASAAKPLYVDDVFSTYLYRGNGSTQTITNGIDLAGEGGLVWVKGRSGATDHALYDTARGATFDLGSNLTTAQTTQSTGLTSFSGTGFALGALAKLNTNAATYASWTFRKAPKFFDIVTYTGNGSNRTIAHNLGSVPGMIIVKCTNNSGNWDVYHRSMSNTKVINLNSTSAETTSSTRWNSTSPTSTVFSLGADTTVNASGDTYVAYLFAHDAGGFGLSENDNVISCGSYTGNGTSTPPQITLGYEAQFVLVKIASIDTGNPDSDWTLIDNMRGFPVGIADAAILSANTTSAEPGAYAGAGSVTSTGFEAGVQRNELNETYIYLAIRRSNKPPTSGTEVFSPFAYTGTGNDVLNAGFVADATIYRRRDGSSGGFEISPRLTRTYLNTTNSGSEENFSSVSEGPQFTNNYGINQVDWWNQTGNAMSQYILRRAPGFFDVVCYTGTGSARTIAHNLTVAPELMIVKSRSQTGTSWTVYNQTIGNTKYLGLEDPGGSITGSTVWDNTTPTSSVFTIGTNTDINNSGSIYVAYLFATLPGISKVGSYTGTGTASVNQINCGFTTGARFVLVKRTDSTGDWIVWDTARGIVSGNDPYLLLNSTAAEVTNTDWIDPLSSGFELSDASGNDANISGASYIFLAIA